MFFTTTSIYFNPVLVVPELVDMDIYSEASGVGVAVGVGNGVGVAVGFGVSDKSDVENIGKFADAAIIGSALINRLKNCKNDNIIKTAESFIESLVE